MDHSLVEKMDKLPKNILVKTSTILPIENSLDKVYVQFNSFKDISGLEILKELIALSKLYCRVFYKEAPKEMILASNEQIEKILSKHQVQERFYYLGEELRRIEVFDIVQNKFLLIIERSKVYQPTEDSGINNRIDLVEHVLNKNKI